MAYFTFVGNADCNKADDKFAPFRKGMTSDKKHLYASANFFISQAANNRANVEIFGMDGDINTYDTDGNKITISFNDRFDEDVVNTVRNLNKNVIKAIEGDDKEFISTYDVAEYLIDHMEDFKGSKLTVTGVTQKNVYKGKISDRFVIRNIYLTDDDAKNVLKVTMKFFWNADSIDLADWKSEKKIIINGYTSDFIDKKTLGADKGANKYVSQQVILDCSKIDFDNEKHVALVKFKMSQLGINYNDGNPKVTIKGNKYVCHNLITNYYNGAEEVPFDESTLTATQKEMIDLGLKTVNDFKPKGQTFGARVTVYKVVDFDARGDFENGYIEIDETANEFEENIFVPVAEESVEEIEKPKTNTSNDDDDDDNVDDLFG